MFVGFPSVSLVRETKRSPPRAVRQSTKTFLPRRTLIVKYDEVVPYSLEIWVVYASLIYPIDWLCEFFYALKAHGLPRFVAAKEGFFDDVAIRVGHAIIELCIGASVGCFAAFFLARLQI